MNQQLREARIRKNLTQQEMAERLGYRSKSGYCNIESGRNEPSVSTALAIAEILELDVASLFSGRKVHDSRTSDKRTVSSA